MNRKVAQHTPQVSSQAMLCIQVMKPRTATLTYGVRSRRNAKKYYEKDHKEKPAKTGTEPVPAPKAATKPKPKAARRPTK